LNLISVGMTTPLVLSDEGGPMLFMIVERFKNGDPVPVYQRFRERGRLAPEGLYYVSSWVDATLTTCYQVMETSDAVLIDQWIANWADLVECEVVPVITSKDAATKLAGAEPPRTPAAPFGGATCAASSAHERLNGVEKGTREMTLGPASSLRGESQ
jgi:uncharacterized protein DUF3303